MYRNLILCLSLLTIACVAPAGAQIVPKTSLPEAAQVKVEPVVQKETKPESVDKGAKLEPVASSKNSEVVETKTAEKSSPKSDELALEHDQADGIVFDSEKIAAAPLPQALQQKVAPAPMMDSKTSSVPSVLTSGDTVRQPGLQNAEALFNIVANGVIVLGIAWGGPSLIMAFMRLGAGQQDGLKCVMHVVLALIGLMAMPGVVNWLVASGRDAGVFVGW